MKRKVFHIDRDYDKSLEQQKKELKSKYSNFEYLWTDKAHGNAKIHFIADEEDVVGEVNKCLQIILPKGSKI